MYVLEDIRPSASASGAPKRRFQDPKAPESELNDKFHVVIRFSIDMPVPQALIPAAEW